MPAVPGRRKRVKTSVQKMNARMQDVREGAPYGYKMADKGFAQEQPVLHYATASISRPHDPELDFWTHEFSGQRYCSICLPRPSLPLSDRHDPPEASPDESFPDEPPRPAA